MTRQFCEVEIILTAAWIGYISAAIISSPGTKKIENTNNITLFWQLKDDFPVSSPWAWFEINKDNTSGDLILEFQGNPDGRGLCKNNSSRSITCYVDGPRIGFILYDVIDSDAGRYVMTVDEDALIPPGPENDSDANLYIIKSPSTPNITGNTPAFENQTLNLTCYAQLLSLPEEMRNQSFMEYTWSGAFTGVGSTFTIGPLQREDDGKNITCRAKEQQASDSLHTENTLQLIVYYAPSNPKLASNTTSVVEGKEEIQLTCHLAEDQHGNPKVYSYYWKYPATTEWVNTTENTQTIDSNTLSVVLHDGDWQCKVGNVAGNGTISQVHVTVNAMPSILEDLKDTTMLVNETLNISCIFKAKPVSIVTWIYNMTEELDTNVIDISSFEQSDGPYTITTSTITWKTSDGNQRKTMNGYYTCDAVNSVGEMTSHTMKLDIQYWPWAISFIGPGDTSDSAEVIEKSEFINRTCYSDCNPLCNYTWINNTNGSIVSYTSMLDLQTPDRYDAGSYTCSAHNIYGQKRKDFTLRVKYSPSVSLSMSNTSDIIQSDNITIICDVDSNPESDIKLYNMTDNTTMETLNSNNKAEYQFINIHCLDTGEYMFTARNDIPYGSYAVYKTVFINVMCAPQQTYQVPQSSVIGVPIGDNYTIEIGILANPYPTISAQNWTFTDYNGTRHEELPDNVNISQHPGAGPLTVVATLTLNNTDNMNYGNYTLEVGNIIGQMAPASVSVVPRGPPSPPSAPRLMDITAVSMTINWTAGFNGGLQQWFTVIYQAEGSDTKNEDQVNSHPDVSRGDVIVHKLKNNMTIKPDTTYNVKIQAENDFKEDAIVYGELANFSTLVKAVFTSDPEVTILDSTAEIHFVISGPLTHILEENCVIDTNICTQSNINVPKDSYTWLSHPSATHDFTDEVPLADVEASKFMFSFWMYDGEDLLDSNAKAIPVEKDGVNTGVIVGIVIAVVLPVALIITFIVLWKRGIIAKKIPKRASEPEVRDNASHQQGEVGPITGDIYAGVIKDKRTTNKPKLPVKPKVTGKEYVYENYEMSVKRQDQLTNSTAEHKTLPFSLIGVDGTIYADLQVTGTPSETGIIHGIENIVTYVDIGLIKPENNK